MKTDDLKIITSLGQALWADPNHAERHSIETVTAVALLNLGEELSFERATLLLLQQALKDGTKAYASAVHLPFFRLLPEERVLLALLHSGQISYKKLASILGKSPEDIAQIAWQSRVHLANAVEHGGSVLHPTGSASFGPHCPEYDFTQPWTQKFLDEEYSQRERLYLQNHMMACTGCREALNRCRQLYYKVESLLPKSPDIDRKIDQLSQAYTRSQLLTSPGQLSLRDTLKIFLGRWDIQIVLGLGLAFFIYQLMRA